MGVFSLPQQDSNLVAEVLTRSLFCANIDRYHRPLEIGNYVTNFQLLNNAAATRASCVWKLVQHTRGGSPMEANQHNTPWIEQRFAVSGFVSFTSMNDALLDGEHLRTLITQVDKDYPWVCNWVGGGRAPSINYMSDAQMQEPRPYIDRSYKIEVRPPFNLKSEQFYAYNRYLRGLAENLAALGLEGVHSVSCWMTIGGGNASYMTPAALDRFQDTISQPGFQQLKALFSGEQK